MLSTGHMTFRWLTMAVAVLVQSTSPLFAQGGGSATPGAVSPVAGDSARPPRQGGAGPEGAGRPGRPGRGAVNREPVRGTAAIRGRVVSAESGASIRRAHVRAQSGGAARQTFTDANGRYELTGLPAGEWTIAAAKAGFVSLRLNQRRPSELVTPLTLAEGEQKAAANFALPRGSVLAGRVTDEFGDPVAGVRVQALAYRLVRGQRQVALVGMAAQTDDTGSYRLYGLGPGDYYVSARAEVAVESSDGAAAYAPTYFPGTGTIAEAQRLSLTTGEEQVGLSFPLLLVRTVTVSGVVTDSTGAGLSSGFVSLRPPFESSEAPQLFASATRVQAGGTFTFRNVAPGTYTLQVTSAGGSRGPGGITQAPEIAEVPIVVGVDDMRGLSVSTTRGATLTGSLVSEEGGPPLPSAALRVRAQSSRPMPGFGQRAVPVAGDRSFLLTGLVGPQTIAVEGLPADWMVSRIEVEGQDVTDAPVDVKGTEPVAARVTLTNRVPEVTGTVRRARPAPVGYHVVVFPADQSKWGASSRYIRAQRASATGTFTIRGLPPGDRYLAVALESLDESDVADPEFLARMTPAATRFSVRAGEKTALELTLVEREP